MNNEFKVFETTTEKLDSIAYTAGQYIIVMSGDKKGQKFYDSIITGVREPFAGNLPSEVTIDWTGDPTTLGVAGLAAGSVVKDKTPSQLLYEITHPFVAPALSMNIVDNNGLFEKNTTKSISSITLTSTGGSEAAFKRGIINLMLNNVIVNSAEYTVTINSETSVTIAFTTPVILDGTIDVTIKANVVINSNTISVSKSYNFVNPVYYGFSSTNTGLDIPTLLLTALKEVKTRGTLTHAYTITNGYSYVMFDKAWGNLVSIMDPNNFNITNSYDKTEVIVNGIAYLLYIAKVPSTINNFAIKFNF